MSASRRPRRNRIENWIEQSRCWVANPRNHPEHIEFLRYAEDTTVPEASRNNPHVAFRVETLEPYTEGPEIVIPPFVVADFVRVASSGSTEWCSSICSI